MWYPSNLDIFGKLKMTNYSHLSVHDNMAPTFLSAISIYFFNDFSFNVCTRTNHQLSVLTRYYKKRYDWILLFGMINCGSQGWNSFLEGDVVLSSTSKF